MEQEIDAFIRFLAVERGLSENYQLSTRRSSLSSLRGVSRKKRLVICVRSRCR